MKGLFIILAKLLGLLLLYWGLSALSSILTITAHSETTREFYNVGQRVLQYASLILFLLVSLGMAFLLLLRTEWIADKLNVKSYEALHIPLSSALVLRVGMKIIGIFIFVSHIQSLFRAFENLRMLGSIFAPVLQLTLALLLVLRTDMVINFINKGEATSWKRLAAGGVVFLIIIVLINHMGVPEFLRHQRF